MNCEEYKKLIDKKLDGEIAAEEDSLLDEHLRKCSECGQYLKLFSSLSPAGIAPSHDFEAKIMDRIEGEKVIRVAEIRERRKRPLLILAGAAAAMVAVFIILFAIVTIEKPKPGEIPEAKQITVPLGPLLESLASAPSIGEDAFLAAGQSLKDSMELVKPKSIALGNVAERIVPKEARDTLKHDYELTMTKLRSLYEEITNEINLLWEIAVPPSNGCFG